MPPGNSFTSNVKKSSCWFKRKKLTASDEPNKDQTTVQAGFKSHYIAGALPKDAKGGGKEP